jgi:hypothetical protein
MSPEEITIAALQNRVHYLEAHLHLALQVLNELEKDYQDLHELSAVSSPYYPQGQTIEVMPTSKVELPTFLHSRTWKQDTNQDIAYVSMNNSGTSDRQIANAS